MRAFNALMLVTVSIMMISQTAKAISETSLNEPAMQSLMTDASFDLTEFNHVDPKHVVPDAALMRAMVYFKKNKESFSNQKYLGIVDYTKKSNQPRLFIVNLKTGSVAAHMTSHGLGSDPGNTGMVRRFSNSPGSDASSQGFYRTGEVYVGKHGRSLRLDGLSHTNSNARSRDIVIHSAWYVTDAARRAGRSDGCIAVDPRVSQKVISQLKGGALLYGWSGKN